MASVAQTTAADAAADADQSSLIQQTALCAAAHAAAVRVSKQRARTGPMRVSQIAERPAGRPFCIQIHDIKKRTAGRRSPFIDSVNCLFLCFLLRRVLFFYCPFITPLSFF